MNGATAYIHLENFRHNIAELKRLAPGKEICLAVKANAYGHGAVGISQEAERIGIRKFGVARISEARELRDNGIQGDILLFSLSTPDDVADIWELGIQPMLSDQAGIEALQASKPAGAAALPVHLKIDTGMHRLGCPPAEALNLARLIHEHPATSLEGIATHFPVSDEPGNTFTKTQIQTMAKLQSDLRSIGIEPSYVHAANSGGILFFSEDVTNMIRPGISAYGYAPDDSVGELMDQRGITLKPVMELKAPVTFIKTVPEGASVSYGHQWTSGRQSVIATVNMGYADGYPRVASGIIEMGMAGMAVPQIGRICMDQSLADVTDHPGSESLRYHEAVIFGPEGPETAETLAVKAGTISYEITCAITARVPRTYLNASTEDA